MVERGVCFVQCSHSYQWDQHGNLKSGPESNAKQVDQPITALIRDLKNRGLLDSSLIPLGTEFERTPVAQGDGLAHNPYGFTLWLAGGGIKGGTSYVTTVELGHFAIESKVSMCVFMSPFFIGSVSTMSN